MYIKTITPAYETIGKRRRLTGYIGELIDGDTLVHAQEYANYSTAENALDHLAYALAAEAGAFGPQNPACDTNNGVSR